MRTFFILIGVLCILFSSVGADAPYIVKVQHFSLGEGLPNRGVLTIGQDHQGFVWIGTLNGAYRFDGTTFKALQNDSLANRNQLEHYVFAYRTDAEKNFWIFEMDETEQISIKIRSPDQRLNRFEEQFNRPLPFKLTQFFNFGRKMRSPVQPTDPILIPGEDGAVWLYESQGRFKKIFQHSTPLALRNWLFTTSGTILLNYPTANPEYSVSSHNELIEIWPSGKVRQKHRIPANLKPIWIDPQGVIYLSHHQNRGENYTTQLPHLTETKLSGFLHKLSPDGKLTEVPISFLKTLFPAPSNYSFSEAEIAYDTRHNLFWYMGQNMLFAWHPSYGIVFDLGSSGFPVSNLGNLNNLFIDRTGAIWFCTDNGFLLLTLEPNHFKRHLYSSEKETTEKHATRGLIQINNWLWANTNHSVWLENLSTGQRKKKEFPSFLPESDKNLKAIIWGHDSLLWTVHEKLIQINPYSLTPKEFQLLNKQIGWSIWQDRRHNFWLGNAEGLSYFDYKKKQVQPFTKYNQYPELANNRVNGFFPDPSAGGIWIAASSGLYLLDTLRGITARYSQQDSAPHHLPFSHITFVHPDPKKPGTYWLSTRGGGLIRWERRTGHFQQYTQENGLSNNYIYSIHEDRFGNLWLPSDYGLMRFDKANHYVRLFLPKDGIAHEEFNLTSHYRAPGGRLFLGGLNGVTSFYPDKLSEEKNLIAPLIVSSYKQLNARTGQQTDHLASFEQKNQIVVPPENRTFSLSFSLLDYRYSQQFRLSYRIVGWQDYWTSQLSHSLSFNGIAPGKYQLEVRAQNPNGQWVSETLVIPILIQAPFYRQGWFLLLAFLILAGVILVFFQLRNYRLYLETKRLETEVARRTAQIAKGKELIEQQAADLQASATLKARFFANVSHELRTPLTLLLGPMVYLSKELSDPTAIRLVNVMDRNARQLLTMVSDLLDLSKLDENGIQMIPQPADLSRLINQTISMFHSQADYTGLHLTAQGTSEPIWLLIDSPKVETVLKNLLANALRFTPSGGTITVRLHTLLDWVHVEVIDTGTGIHPNDLPHIFERYYQSQQTDVPLQGGTGIGLALAYDYCHLWGGELTVESEYGKGSTFSFTHPYQPVQPTAAQQTLPPSSEHSTTVSPVSSTSLNLEALRILLVEDNRDMVAYLETILAPLYQLHITHNGREAWEWLGSQPTPELPHLIVTDLMMPEMDGMTFVNHIRHHSVLRSIPVLMLTARSSQDVKMEALRLGIADYMTKPFDQDELTTRINNLLERSLERTIWQQQDSSDENSIPVPISQDEEWLLQIRQLTLDNLANRYFQVNNLADTVNSSERQLYRRLKKLTGFSPNQFMQEIRLQTAREWLENRQFGTVKEVCYAVGFQDVVYFSRLFLKRFGKYPTSFLNNPAATTDDPITSPPD